jgi:hypothetical protein
MRKTSRIFSSARWSAGDGGFSDVDVESITTVGALEAGARGSS